MIFWVVSVWEVKLPCWKFGTTGTALTAKGFINKENDSVNIEGLVAPTYAIDSWIGNIPIIGTIVTGIEGGGVFAANYSVKGTVKDPKYFVNPLSVLTPGLFKDFWKIFQNPID